MKRFGLILLGAGALVGLGVALACVATVTVLGMLAGQDGIDIEVKAVVGPLRADWNGEVSSMFRDEA